MNISAEKWNRMWDMYASGELAEDKPDIYALCDYDSGVNGEGHSGWFYNTKNTEGSEGLKNLISALFGILPEHLCDNLEKAIRSYDTEDEDDICEEADDYFYEHEREILAILENYANSLSTESDTVSAVSESLSEQINRITYYEKLMDSAVKLKKGAPERQKLLAELEKYYTSDAWKRDFAADEAGLLPKELKRGVLSEDGIYSMLEEADE